MDDRAPFLTWLSCFLAGGIAGASVALLLAPQSGEVTRQVMRRKLRDTAGSVRDLKARMVRGREPIRYDVAGVDPGASGSGGNGPGTVGGRPPEGPAI